MGKKLILAQIILFIFLCIGCAQSDLTAKEGDSSTAEKAIKQGKLSLADGDVEKAKSNFHLALTEDEDNKEARTWLDYIEKYSRLAGNVDEKEADDAMDLLNEIKADEKYAIIKGLTQPYEHKLDELAGEVKALEAKLEGLDQLFDPSDETAMPSEDYLAKADEILANPYITEEQKETVKKFKRDAAARADKLLAIEAEKQRTAEREAKEASDPYEWTSGVKEQFEKDIMSRGYVDSADSIRYEKMGIYNNQGYYTVYGKLDGVEHAIVSVNVKTGDYHG